MNRRLLSLVTSLIAVIGLVMVGIYFFSMPKEFGYPLGIFIYYTIIDRGT